jgi:hypothetical protein
VDAVWTGKGLPSEEMSYHQRLGLPPGTTQTKLIRRAYHKKSLEWHPDRWASMINSVAQASIASSQRRQEQSQSQAQGQGQGKEQSAGQSQSQRQRQRQSEAEAVVGAFSASLYTLAVQGAFELVVEAYKALMGAAK